MFLKWIYLTTLIVVVVSARPTSSSSYGSEKSAGAAAAYGGRNSYSPYLNNLDHSNQRSKNNNAPAPYASSSNRNGGGNQRSGYESSNSGQTGAITNAYDSPSSPGSQSAYGLGGRISSLSSLVGKYNGLTSGNGRASFSSPNNGSPSGTGKGSFTGNKGTSGLNDYNSVSNNDYHQSASQPDFNTGYGSLSEGTNHASNGNEFGSRSGGYGNANNNGYANDNNHHSSTGTGPGNGYGNGNNRYPGSSSGSANGEDPLSEPANYEFSYEVDAPEYNLQFGHKESRQGNEANGLYHVLLPDGRTQIVEYEADQDGYKPKISYQDTNSGLAGSNAGGVNGFKNGGANSNGYGSGAGGNSAGTGGYDSHGSPTFGSNVGSDASQYNSNRGGYGGISNNYAREDSPQYSRNTNAYNDQPTGVSGAGDYSKSQSTGYGQQNSAAGYTAFRNRQLEDASSSSSYQNSKQTDNNHGGY